MSNLSPEQFRTLVQELERMMRRHTIACAAAVLAPNVRGTSGIAVDKALNIVENIERTLRARTDV